MKTRRHRIGRPARASLLAAVLLAAAAQGRAAEGPFEISSARIPMTITNPGSYIVTEDIDAVNGELIAAGSTWKYLDDGSDQGTGWTTNGFDDSTWASGAAMLGYGYANVATTNSYGSNPSSKPITTYYRQSFSVTNKSRFVHMDLFVRRDDGIVVYVNGNEVRRDNMPAGTITFNTLASSALPDGFATQTLGDPRDTYYEFYVSPTNLVNGANIVAAEVHQAAANSPDLLFDLALNAYTNGSGDPTNAITIAVDGVSLDLRNHVLRGTELSSRNGVEILPGVRGAIIRNGTVTRWGDSGIQGEFATNCVISNIRSIRNFYDGIIVGPSATIQECVVARNGRTAQSFEKGDGIVVEEGAIIQTCTSYDNHDHGYLAHSSSDLTDCVTARNSHDGVHGGPGLMVARCISANSPLSAENKHGEGIEIQIGSLVMDSISWACDDGIKTRFDTDSALFYRCTSISNFADGLKGGVGNLFVQCNAFRNSQKGFNMTSHSVIMRCMAERNGLTGTRYAGIQMKGNGNMAAFNHVVANSYGITNSSAFDVIVGNSAAYNERTNFVGNLSNAFATPTNNAATLRPWANFRLGN